MGRTSEAVAEGVAIATAAARLAVRNHILVEVIAHDASFDVAAIEPFARDTLLALADEQDAAAALARQQIKTAWGLYTDSGGTHDYRSRDTRNLRRRRRQYLRVADELRGAADDEVRLHGLIEHARDAAWGDVAANLERRLDAEGMTASADPDYARMREARLQSFRLIDFARLAAQAKARRTAGEA